MARRSSHCGLCSHLLHQQMVCLPGLDQSAAAAPQMKVEMKKKVQVELQRAAAAQSGDPSSEPRGRKGSQLAQMTEGS